MPAVTTSSQPGSSTATSPNKKFNTVGGSGQHAGRGGLTSSGTSALAGVGSNRASIRGLFEASRTPTGEQNGVARQEVGATQGKRTGKFPQAVTSGTMGREDGPWSVSVAEAPAQTSEKRESRKKAKLGLRTYTLYVTTPTHNLTLLRSNVDLTELDAKLREGQSVASALPTLPPLQVTAQQTSRKILQTISRTLSPGVTRNRGGLSTLTAPNLGLAEPSMGAKKPASPATSGPNSPAAEEARSTPETLATTSQLANYLTTISNVPLVRKHKAWRRFIRVGSDDLESVRVERRVRKVRSDLAQHVKSSVAPTNTNVGATPSHSDIGEEGGRTDDDRSTSGRSTSHSYRRNDRPDVPSRSTSVDPERGHCDDRDGSRQNNNFAGIPEEIEKQTPEEELGETTKAADSSVAKRDRKYRRHVQREAEKVTVDDFDMIRVLGKGCAGKVLLVRHLPTKGLFAMKSIHKRHVLAHQELQHTLTEQAVLKRMAKEVMDPFVVKLWWSFHDKNNLYLVMDFHPGGDLATQLSRWGRLGRDRARFYAAEIVEGVEGLHKAGVIYRDLKPENVLIGSDGHIVLSDFGLSKEFPARDRGEGTGSATPPPASPNRSHSSKDIKSHSPHWLSASEDNRSSGTASANTSFDALNAKGTSRSRWADERDVTTTFCGTAEYLAPEVIQGAAYSYEVDWWSFGTMLYEMLTGITPFWADTHADMYVRVLHDELVFPDDRVLDQDTKSILRGLLQRNPMLRMKEPRIKRHPYFSMIEWAHVFHKRYIPPYIPPIDPLDETDTQNFDEAFLDMQPVVNGAEDGVPGEDGAEAEADGDATAVSNGMNADAKGSGRASTGGKSVNKEAHDAKSLFDGYSFRGRKDSGSIKSSILSMSAPSDDQPASEVTTADAAPVAKPAIPPATNATPRTSTAPEATIEEDEDDDSAARAAVAALDLLEREAARAEEVLSSPSHVSSSTRPTSSAATTSGKESSDDGNTSSTVAGTTKGVRLGGVMGLASHAPPIAETDDEGEDDWDLVDVPTAGEVIHSEVNGGKGQNLFARGVVDTYRLLRRQESSRLPSSPSYGSGSSNRPFNRLSRRNRSSRSNLRPSTAEQNRNGSAVSLSRSSANEGGSRVSEEGSREMEQEETRIGGPSPLPSSSAIATPVEETSRQSKPGSPSLASSEEAVAAEKSKTRMKKMKRFTTFFETIR